MSKVEKLAFFGIGEINSPDWIWMVATHVTDTPFVLALMENLYTKNIKKGDPHIGNMAVLISIRI